MRLDPWDHNVHWPWYTPVISAFGRRKQKAGLQGHLPLHREFGAILGYMLPFLKKKKKPNFKESETPSLTKFGKGKFCTILKTIEDVVHAGYTLAWCMLGNTLVLPPNSHSWGLFTGPWLHAAQALYYRATLELIFKLFSDRISLNGPGCLQICDPLSQAEVAGITSMYHHIQLYIKKKKIGFERSY